MRLNRLVRSVSWKHAFGEVLLIVIGITIALAVNSWWEDQQDRRSEDLILQQLRAALQADLIDLEAGLAWASTSRAMLDELWQRLRNSGPLGPEMNSALAFVPQWITVNTRRRTGPYEELKNDGFSLISDEAIRSQIIEVYEIQFASLMNVVGIDEQFSLNQVAPHIYQNFHRFDDDQWTPIAGYQSLHADAYFINLVSAKLRRLENYIIPTFETTIRAVEDLLSAMEPSKQ